MRLVVVTHHHCLVTIRLAAARIDAWYLAPHRPLLVANHARCTWLLLATALEVGIEEMLRREGSVAERARNCDSLVVLRPGVGVEGAWINAQLGGVLWAIVDEDFLVRQDVLDSPAMIMVHHTAQVSI